MHTANTLAYFKNSFCFKKYILPWNFKNKEKMYFSMNFAKKNHFLHFWILQHVCKTPQGIGQYSKNIKILFLGIYFSRSVFG